MSSYPLISIITLNYNQPEATNRFLDSSTSLTYGSYEILVCDMGSSIEPVDNILISRNPRARLLRSQSNLGFAAGNNWAIKQAKGEYLFLVNNDTLLTPTILESLLEPLIEDPSIAVSCPKIKHYPFNNRIEYAGFNSMNFYTGRTSSIGFNKTDDGQFSVSRQTYGAHGCAMMVRKKVLQECGMFPEEFFLYYEEWDLSTRIQKAGYKIWYVGEAEIFHEGSATIGINNPLKDYYLTRNRILFMRRNASSIQLFIFYLFFYILTVPKSIITYLFRGQPENLKSFLKALSWNFSHPSISRLG